MHLLWSNKLFTPIVALALSCLASVAAAASPPAQRVPAALLAFPYIQSDGVKETRVELLNLSPDRQELNCFWVSDCNEIGFFLFLTPYQPLSWLVSTGLSDVTSGAAAPPFFGTGELKCAVVAAQADLQFHNTIQGRAIVYDSAGQTVSYNAVGFQRLTPGDYTGVLSLNGTTYAQCPDKLHFDLLADTPTSQSELILVPCSQDLLYQEPVSTNVQFQIINEFEQAFSAAKVIECYDRRTLGEVSDTLNRSTDGTDTLHLVVRGSAVPVIGLAIDSVPFGASNGISGNEPSLQGGRSATVVFP